MIPHADGLSGSAGEGDVTVRHTRFCLTNACYTHVVDGDESRAVYSISGDTLRIYLVAVVAERD